MEATSDLSNCHKCKMCNYRTKHLRNILIHVRQHHFNCHSYSPGKYQCEKCQFQSDLKVELTKHFSFIHKNEETGHYPNAILKNCNNCDFQTYSSLVILNHNCVVVRNHPLICNIIYSPQEYQTHLKLKTEETKHEASQNLPPEENSNSLEHEKEEQHSNLTKRFKCDHCSCSVTRKTDLQIHILRKHTPSEHIPWFKCNQCSFKSKEKKGLRRHVLLLHTKPTELEKLKHFECDHCSYKTIHKSCWQMHILRKHTPSEQINWFKCKDCSFQSKEKKGLLRHMRFIHTKPADLEKLKRFKCEHCSYKTTKNSKLKEHVLYKHTPLDQIVWFQCDECSYKAKTKSLLHSHTVRQHTDSVELEKLKPFKCDHCSYRAVRELSLKNHLLRVHATKTN